LSLLCTQKVLANELLDLSYKNRLGKFHMEWLDVEVNIYGLSLLGGWTPVHGRPVINILLAVALNLVRLVSCWCFLIVASTKPALKSNK
jgi:hypothetical protein